MPYVMTDPRQTQLRCTPSFHEPHRSHMPDFSQVFDIEQTLLTTVLVMSSFRTNILLLF
jgi:hypothetical protein